MMKLILFTFLFSALPRLMQGQDLTGTWVGHSSMSFVKLVVIHKGDSLFGYTYDEGPGWCQASFLGQYQKQEKFLKGKGIELLHHSGNHDIGLYKLNYIKREGSEHLNGTVQIKAEPWSIFRYGLPSQVFLRRETKEVDTIQYMRTILEEQQNQPRTPTPKVTPSVVLTETPIKPHIEQPKVVQPNKPTVEKTVIASKPEVENKPKPVVKAPPTVAVANDTVVKKDVAAPPKVFAKSAPDPFIKMKDERSSKLVETIYTFADSVKMYVYDNGEVDDDTVTVFVNNVMVLDRYRISEKAKEISFPVSNNGGVHTIELFANNLGSIPPNTALIILVAGKERFELRASYDLSTNAKIVIKHLEQ